MNSNSPSTAFPIFDAADFDPIVLLTPVGKLICLQSNEQRTPDDRLLNFASIDRIQPVTGNRPLPSPTRQGPCSGKVRSEIQKDTKRGSSPSHRPRIEIPVGAPPQPAPNLFRPWDSTPWTAIGPRRFLRRGGGRGSQRLLFPPAAFQVLEAGPLGRSEGQEQQDTKGYKAFFPFLFPSFPALAPDAARRPFTRPSAAQTDGGLPGYTVLVILPLYLHYFWYTLFTSPIV